MLGLMFWSPITREVLFPVNRQLLDVFFLVVLGDGSDCRCFGWGKLLGWRRVREIGKMVNDDENYYYVHLNELLHHYRFRVRVLVRVILQREVFFS